MIERRNTLDGSGLKISIVAARFNDAIVRELVHGARDTLLRLGVADDDIDLTWVPGAFELPLLAKQRAIGPADAVICLGAVIRGATPHFDYVCSQAASGIAAVSADTGVPVIFGVLTTDTIDQAVERAGTKSGNKGSDAAMAAVEMARLVAEG